MGWFALLIKFQIFWNRNDAICRKLQQTFPDTRGEGMPSRQRTVEVVHGKLFCQWSLWSLHQVTHSVVLIPHWTEGRICPQPSLGFFPLALAPLVAWSRAGTQIWGLIQLRSKLKTTKKQLLFFSFLMEKDKFPEGVACLPALLVQARGEVGHILRWVDGGAGGCNAAAWAGLCHPSSRYGTP